MVQNTRTLLFLAHRKRCLWRYTQHLATNTINIHRIYWLELQDSLSYDAMPSARASRIKQGQVYLVKFMRRNLWNTRCYLWNHCTKTTLPAHTARTDVQPRYQGHQRCLHSTKPEFNPASTDPANRLTWETPRAPIAEVTRRFYQLAQDGERWNRWPNRR